MAREAWRAVELSGRRNRQLGLRTDDTAARRERRAGEADAGHSCCARTTHEQGPRDVQCTVASEGLEDHRCDVAGCGVLTSDRVKSNLASRFEPSRIRTIEINACAQCTVGHPSRYVNFP